ncbi:MAG: MaoC family dehydratase [Candidatus Thiodiazotropha taylori]|nr:MaoC family dehydratase [Candidatus Thiodiazotropha taylori]
MHTIETLAVGMSASYSQTITDYDIRAFAGLSGDRNPVHLDDIYAEASRFKKRIAHGMISASFFSAIFGTQLPGKGCVYVSQDLNFRKPVYIDDTVTAVVEITAIDLETRKVHFNTYCIVKKSKVITVTAVIYMPDIKK